MDVQKVAKYFKNKIMPIYTQFTEAKTVTDVNRLLAKYMNQSVYFPVSFDIGTGMRIKRISVLITYDVLKKDASINVGYNF
jgi:hypothetical protein